ncbi:Coenzyme F420 hydrogenase/dehydrogenase, beta subunit C-terminal domain [Anaerocolumna sp. MB42-C2]|uniref:Coenzyme F420 hydrogenase/dehydrogenase, beta subunit C-terminal domain n=1 Tax=Anaerocolumna sp. MB42-C2 TaxID=3070997 RepID=UPI0027E10AA5|nr:Coenzyme F420 hydrogenase/dehydrogenase, beta subunit C-terminal domain [Anaerocolumna sp. MB42-C2]WMJ89683.1 Coenzyme F420 hydrogenase/dehydrogenase, beta subunit C-terminal domain [Anaerocolumna sp. MB42-C2]
MINLYANKKKCCGCTACLNICPNNSITMEKDKEGFLYPVIDTESCTSCEACVRVCPFHKKEYKEKIPKDQAVYAMRHTEKSVLKKSTSGGAFTVISDYVLEQGGIVYGAVFNDRFEVVHNKAADKKQRDKMRGSKYVQSDLGTIFKEIKNTLESGKNVLFTGTPCQNDGLKNYLKKEYSGLILCDIACHGVPSPKIWTDYKTYLEEMYHDKVKEVNFRSKDTGWRNSSLKVELTKNIYIKNMQEDPFYILFFSHLILRPSCHECIYANYHRVTDLTLADYWGIEKSNRAFDDDNGVSLVLANTKKGKDLIKAVKNKTEIAESSHDDFYQPIFEAPSKISSKRKIFWEEYINKGKIEVLLKYGRLTPVQWVIKKIAVPVLKKTGLYTFIIKVYFK